jgi:hypothetical protein
MTVDERAVLLGLVAEVEDLRALVTVLLGRNEQTGDPALLLGDKEMVRKGNQPIFDEMRKQIDALL